MSRIKLALFEPASVDCHACLKLSGPNMKAYFILSQCLLALHDVDGALENALLAYRLGSETNDKSLAHLTGQVLRCKKERWDEREKKRTRQSRELENQLVSLLQREQGENIALCSSEMEADEVMEESQKQINLLLSTFEAARSASEKKREVPDWVIDDISFGIMVDPVMVSVALIFFEFLLSCKNCFFRRRELTEYELVQQTKTGKSYERASIMEALRRHPIDPLTREPLYPSELRPNLGLKQACEEFLEQNGWAVDW